MPTDCALLCLDLPKAEALRYSRLTPEAAASSAARARDRLATLLPEPAALA